MARFLVLCCVLFTPLAFGSNSDSASANSNDFVQSSQYLLGGIGLINTPTARFSDDGEFGMGISLDSPFNRMFGEFNSFLGWKQF